MPNILIIENQYSQFKVIAKKLEQYQAFPLDDEYGEFMDLIRVRLNKRYDNDRRKRVFESLVGYINKNKIDLFIIDYKLSGCHDGLNGINLAVELKGISQFADIPIIFLSRTPQNTKEVSDDLELINKYPWIEKGYAGLSLFEDSYFKKFILDKIPELIVVSRDEKYKKILRDLYQRSKSKLSDHVELIDKALALDHLPDEYIEVIEVLNDDLQEMGDTKIKKLLKTFQ